MDKEWQVLKQQIAEKNQVSCECVQQELEQLIDQLWNGKDFQTRQWMGKVAYGKKPTPFQLIQYLAKQKRIKQI